MFIESSRWYDHIYARTRERLHAAIACVAHHLEPGGIALIEPWFVREAYNPGKVYTTMVDEPELKICRMNRSDSEGDLSVIDFHYLVATPEDGVRHFRERHELGMFAIDDFAKAGLNAGLTHEHIKTDRFARGLHIFRPEA